MLPVGGLHGKHAVERGIWAPTPHVCTVRSASAFLNVFRKSCSVRVFNTTCDSASIISNVSKWRPFNFIFNRGNRKVVQVGDDSHVVFRQKFPGEKGSVRRCIVVMQQPVVLSPKFGVKSSHIFTQSPRHSSMRNLLFGLPGRSLCEQSPWHLRMLVKSLPGLSSHISEICTKFDEHPLLGPSRNRIRPYTRPQIKRGKKSSRPSCVKFCTLTPKMC
jgi:hypothetical protein